MTKIFGIFNEIAGLSKKRVDRFGAQYATFGLFGVINYPFSFLVLYYLESQENESLWLRLLACSLCIPLILHNLWPRRARFYLPLYWHLTLLYCIPFFAAVMLLRNGLSLEWLLNLLLGLFLFVLLVDWLTFLIMLSLGAVLGIVFYSLTGGYLDVGALDANLSAYWSLILYLYFYAVVIGVLFARNREKINEVKLETLKSLAYSIAHEMRTPLAAIAAGASNLSKFLPIYEEGYVKAAQAGLMDYEIPLRQLGHIKDIPIVMERVSYNAQNIIDMLLMKAREVESIELEPCSIGQCVRTALQQYPLTDNERASIRVDDNNDFIFQGKEEMLLHVIFNLLKNSLHQISFVSHGEISMWTTSSDSHNFLHFKDNGGGVSKKVLDRMFDRFTSGTEFGTGMGLAYCKMAMTNFGGDISCISCEGHGAEFVLSFPIIEDIGSSAKDGAAVISNLVACKAALGR